MTEASSLAGRAFELGQPVYGLTTGLGAQKRTSPERDDAGFGWRQIAESRAGVGPEAPPDVVRAAMLVFAQPDGRRIDVHPARPCGAPRAGAQRGSAAARAPARLARRLRPRADGRPRARRVRRHGPRTGRGTRADELERLRHGLAALARRRRRPARGRRRRGRGALPGGLRRQPRACCTRRWSAPRRDPVLARTLARFRELLEGSYLWEEGAARNLQDPLTYRSTAPVQAAARRAVDHAALGGALELNAAQGNPLVSVEDGRILSTSAYEVVGLSAALDYARIGLATMLSAASERSVKLLDTPWSGLPTGLLERGGPDLGLSILAITAQSLVAEAFTLAQPVSFTVASSAGAEGIEDRASHLYALRAPARGGGRARRRRRGHRAAGVGAGGGRARVRAARPPDGSGVRAHPAGRADHEGRGHAAGGREPGEQAHPREPRAPRAGLAHDPRARACLPSMSRDSRAHRLAPSMRGLRIVGRLLHIGGGT